MDDVTFLSKTIFYRDNINNRMGQEDVVNLVTEMSQNDNQKTFGIVMITWSIGINLME